MSQRIFIGLSSFVFLVCAAIAQAQEKPAPFLIRITELHASNYTCTVITLDRRLRREVSSIDTGQVGRPNAFEGAASEDDVTRTKALVTQPDFDAAARSNPELTMVSPQGGIYTVEVNLDSKVKTVTFADRTGTTQIPSYLRELLSFAHDVKGRKLRKLKGKVETMCRTLSQH